MGTKEALHFSCLGPNTSVRGSLSNKGKGRHIQMSSLSAYITDIFLGFFSLFQKVEQCFGKRMILYVKHRTLSQKIYILISVLPQASWVITGDLISLCLISSLWGNPYFESMFINAYKTLVC